MNTLYNLHYDITAFVLYCVIIYFFFIQKEVVNLQNRLFIGMIFTNMAAAVVNLFFAFMLSDPLWFPSKLIFASSSVGLVLYVCMPFIFFLYILAVTGRLFSYGKKYFFLISIPFLFAVGIIVTNMWTHNLFYIHNGRFLRSILFSMMIYVVEVFYVGAVMYFMIRYRMSVSFSQYGSILLFSMTCLLAGPFQVFFKYVNIELFFYSINSLLLFLTIEDEKDLLNPGTKVYNRDALISHMNKALNAKRPFTVILIKLGNIRSLISILGIDVINGLMAEIADYLEQLMIDRRYIYDCNHYTFAIVFIEKNTSRVKDVIKSIEEKFHDDWIYNGMSVPLTIVMGVVNVPLDLRTVDSLLMLVDNTEENLYERFSVIKETQLNFLTRGEAIESCIRKAIEENSLQVYYQPIWDCRKNNIHSAEAFIRLKDKALESVPVEDIISVAEKSGTIRNLGINLINSACDFMISSAARNLKLDYVSLNISIVQSLQRDLPFIFREALESHGLRPDFIHLDIKETSSIMTTSSAVQNILRLRDMGFSLALDHFGTINSNPSSIFILGFSAIKIDRSVLNKSDFSDSARIFMKNIIRMFKEMGMDVTVSGVESKEQKDFVTECGADFCQGYYFAPPMPEKEFVRYCQLQLKSDSQS